MPGDPADDSRSFTSSHIGDKVENSSRPQAKTGPGLRPGAIQPRRLARPGGTWSRSAERETPPFIFAWAKMNQNKNKKRGRSRATSLRPKAAHANQPAGLVCRDFVPHVGRSPVWNKIPVKGEPSFRDGSLHERARRAKNLAACGARLFFCLIDSRAGHRESKGDSARCDGRLRALP